MKKSVYISGITCANLMLFGSLAKIMHWPGSGILLTLGIFLFCFYFLPVALINSYREEQKKYKWLHLVTFLVFFIGMMGVLFKVQHWPGAAIFLLIGVPLPFVLFLPVYLYQTRNDKDKGNMNFLGIMFGLTFLAVFTVLLSLNVSKHILERAALNINSNETASVFFTATRKTTGTENKIKQNAEELCTYIAQLKCELLTGSNNNVCENNVPKPDYNPMQIFNKDNVESTMHVLYSDGTNNKITALKNKIDGYREALLASDKMNPDMAILTNVLLNTTPQEVNKNNEPVMLSWEEREFSNRQLIFVLDALSEIQSNVRLLENEIGS